MKLYQIPTYRIYKDVSANMVIEGSFLMQINSGYRGYIARKPFIFNSW